MFNIHPKVNPLPAMIAFTVAITGFAFVAEALDAPEPAPTVVTTTTEAVEFEYVTPSEFMETYQGEGGPEPEYHLPSTTTTTTEPPLRMWEGKIGEAYGEGTGCSVEEASIIAREFWAVGAFDDDVEWALMMISRESLCRSYAHNGDRSTGDDSWGLCQQNRLSGWFNEGKLLEHYDRYEFADNFELNAESCALMWSVCGRGPWNYGNYYCSTPKKQDTGTY